MHAMRSNLPETSRPEPIRRTWMPGWPLGKAVGADCVCIAGRRCRPLRLATKNRDFVDQLRVAVTPTTSWRVRGEACAIVNVEHDVMLDNSATLYDVPVVNRRRRFQGMWPRPS